MTFVSKSGGNAYHGSAYEFIRNNDFDANNFFNNAAQIANSIYKQNDFVATIGGPLWIPKVFNGKDRVFWMFAWEGLRDSDPANSPRETGSPINFATVPTAARVSPPPTSLPR